MIETARAVNRAARQRPWHPAPFVLGKVAMRYEIRAMSFGEILDTGFQLLRNHFKLLIGLSLVMYAPIAALSLALEILTAGESVSPLAIGMTAVPLGLAIVIAAPIVAAAITFALGGLYLGREVTFEGSLRAALSIILPLMGTSILAYLLMLAGFLALVVPGIYLIFAFFLLWQIMVLEGVFGIAAMRRSHELMKGNKLRALGIILVTAIIAGVIGTGLQLVLGLVPYLGSIASSFTQAVSSVFTTAVSVVLYFDIRCRQEAFDLEHLARLVEGRDAGPMAQPTVR
jgi:hypothetical protein